MISGTRNEIEQKMGKINGNWDDMGILDLGAGRYALKHYVVLSMEGSTKDYKMITS